MNTLITLILVATPAMLGFYFMFPDWRKGNNFDYYIYLLTALGFMSYVILLTYLLIVSKILGYDSIAFLIPIGLVFAGLFLTAKMNISTGGDLTIRILIGIVAMLFAIPMNILVTNIKDKKIKKLKKLQRKNLR